MGCGSSVAAPPTTKRYEVEQEDKPKAEAKKMSESRKKMQTGPADGDPVVRLAKRDNEGFTVCFDRQEAFLGRAARRSVSGLQKKGSAARLKSNLAANRSPSRRNVQNAVMHSGVSDVLSALVGHIDEATVVEAVTGWSNDRRKEKAQREVEEASDCPDSPRDGTGVEVIDSISSPGAPEGQVAFVFTDIANSTALWESVPDGMDDALSIHNEVARLIVKDCNGFEVKTIGDAFMVAFHQAVDAMRFCLTLQQELNEQEWPDELGECSHAAVVEGEDGSFVYNGLRVRTGCHVGEVIKETNPVTGRADYRGPTVNIAARTEAQGRGGRVMITDDVLQAIDGELEALGNPVIKAAGSRKMKGVGQPMKLHAAVPAHLKARLDDKEEDKKEEAKVQKATTGLGKALGMKMRRTGGTVCVTRPDLGGDPALGVPPNVLDEACDFIRGALTEAGATEGQLESVTGDALVLAWNTSRACAAHMQQALRFCGLLHSLRNPSIASKLGGLEAAPDDDAPAADAPMPGRRQRRRSSPFVPPPDIEAKETRRAVFGVSTGKLLHGTLGTARQSYRVVIGHQERIAQHLADHCGSFGCFALVTQRPGDDRRDTSMDGIRAHLRPIDIWRIAPQREMLVEQVDLVSLADAEREFGVWEFLSDGAAAGMGGGEVVSSSQRKRSVKQMRKKSIVPAGYCTHFHEAIRGSEGDLGALRGMIVSEAGEGRVKEDAVLGRVCMLIDSHIRSGRAATAPGGARYVVPWLPPEHQHQPSPSGSRGGAGDESPAGPPSPRQAFHSSTHSAGGAFLSADIGTPSAEALTKGDPQPTGPIGRKGKMGTG